MKEISLHLLDIIQNSVAARANRISLRIYYSKCDDMLNIEIADNGCGMDEKMLRDVENPFSTTRTTRKVGLGIPLFKAAAESTGGYFSIKSAPGVGTEVRAGFVVSSVDRLPLGDLAGVVADLVMAGPEIDYVLTLECGERLYDFNTCEIKKMLGDVPISEFGILEWIRNEIKGGICEIFGGVLNEVDS